MGSLFALALAFHHGGTAPRLRRAPLHILAHAEREHWALTLPRPEATPAWVPDVFVRIRPVVQAVVLLPLYLTHVLVLPDLWLYSLVSADVVASVGVCSIAVIACAWSGGFGQRFRRGPWNVPQSATSGILPCCLLLYGAYILSAHVAVVVDALAEVVAALGAPLTAEAQTGLKGLACHIAWVVPACHILGRQLKPFYPQGGGKWFSARWQSLWLYWAICGYCASKMLYSAARHLVFRCFPLPLSALVVGTIMGPDSPRTLAETLLVSLAPCVTAPVFEEVVYRGFLFAALSTAMPVKAALPVQAVVFAAHHMNLRGFLPLAALGLCWGGLYLFSGNLVTSIVVHAMWNLTALIERLL